MQLTSEWLETNGTGGFACGTVSGELRRRWHGLLWIARKPPRHRIRLLAGLVEVLRHPLMAVPLSSRWEGGRWHLPAGWPTFEPFPLPHWKWELEGGAVLHKYLLMPHGSREEAILCYRLDPSPEQDHLRLSFYPVLPMESNDDPVDSNGYRLASLGDRTLYVHATEELKFIRRGESLGEVALEIEKDCEDVHTELLWSGPELSFEVRAGHPVFLRFGTEEKPEAQDLSLLLERESERRLALPAPPLTKDWAHLGLKLAHAADQFFVREGAGSWTLMAGYPWFTDWGRDTMMALRGLHRAPKVPNYARNIVEHFLRHLDGGVIPNYFPENGEAPEYNTADATLWLIAVFFRYWNLEELKRKHRRTRWSIGVMFRLLRRTQEGEHPLWQALKQIVDAHEKGTGHGVSLDEDGLLRAGETGTQLTWMDVNHGGEIATPRHGKPVEIQALWYNALCLMADAANSIGDAEDAARYRALAEKARAAFAQRFLAEDREHLADVADRDGPGTADWSIRPNMVIPFWLHHNIIPEEKRPDVLRAAAKELLTPRGLRSLSRRSPEYRGIYQGNHQERDRAYHQGTVWFWLAGPYITGVRRERDRVPELAEELPALIKELVFHFEQEACLNQAGEIFDGDMPYTPRGCFAQAWSVAALVDILSEAAEEPSA